MAKRKVSAAKKKEDGIPLYRLTTAWLNGNGEMICRVLDESGERTYFRLADPTTIRRAGEPCCQWQRRFLRSEGEGGVALGHGRRDRPAFVLPMPTWYQRVASKAKRQEAPAAPLPTRYHER